MADVDSLIVASAAFVVIAGLLKRKRKKKRWWTTALYRNRLTTRGPSFLSSMVEEENDGHFKNFTRMSSADFNFLLEAIRDDISRNDTKFRKAVTAEERLAITLRYLATGDSYTSLQYLFNVSKQLISKIVPEVCRAVVKTLSKHVKKGSARCLEIVQCLGVTEEVYRCLGVTAEV
ncbi:hypothetical protein NQ315_015916 [Exocentrus adspersus]|uniref:DUF8040 domain-containing protein n=1 Tax=Exocentrus adspersus TaxID=1586481 RepID=A0AAV8V7M8_9CUCU|nr:hypothetical protein NQ315_015916 [Exocentrus adspersus]